MKPSTVANFCAGLLIAASPLAALSQAYPSKPLRLVNPLGTGGTAEALSRLLAKGLSDGLGQPVVVESMTGAAGTVGVHYVTRATPDGYTLLYGVTGANSIAPSIYRKLPYDGEKELAPISIAFSGPNVLLVNTSLNVSSVRELVAMAKQKPGELAFASAGNGSMSHLNGELLKAQAGIDLLHVPYKGQAPALTDLLGGQVNVMFGSWLDVRDYIKAGRLTCLGMASLKRSPFAPEIPSLAEQGAPIESNTWAGLVAPAATPDAVVARLNAEINKALALRSTIDSFAKNSVTPLPGTQEQFAAYMRSEVARFADIIQKAHITAEI
jgi:tripartite-type tricarboxylate transporter receptor subunit TctC